MNKSWKYFFFLAWLSYLFICGILLFTRGFLLTRRSLRDQSSCDGNLDCTSFKKLSEKEPTVLNTQLFLDCLDGDQLRLRQSTNGPSFRCSGSNKKVVLLLIDALRYDFAYFNHSVKENDWLPYQNRLKIIDELLSTVPDKSMLTKFIANPPTTTMQRLKGLTTGSLPTFIDVGSNFAATEIDEDNILDQLISQKKNIVFMGDDTWVALYPNRFIREYPFSSFNVWDLDSVDNGILNYLEPEMKKKDWNLLIAHFLGVDHCGHRYGPYHKEMTRKLNQMNGIISNVISMMDNNTVLLVMGDHGMTPSGDHGGESKEEVTAALFMYSPIPFLSSELIPRSEVVYQVDIVPTISALLGFAIPFSNLGKVILEALPMDQTLGNGDILYATNVLQYNIEQMMLYINTYSRQIHVFSKEKIGTLSQKFYELKKTLDSVNSTKTFQLFHNDSIQFMNYLREMCEEIWVQFDSFSMSRGLVLTFLLLSFSFFIVEGIPSDHLIGVLENGFLIFAYAIVILCAIASVLLEHYKIVEDAYLFTYVSTLTVSIFTMAIVVVQNWEEITNLWYTTSRNREWLDITSRFIHLCSLLILFSNSFVIEEGTVLSFLLNAIVWLTVLNTVSFRIEQLKNKGSDKLHWFSKIYNQPKFKQIVLAVIFTLLLRISHTYWRCREEQKWCLMTADSGFSTLKSGRPTMSSVATTVLIALFISLVKMWLRSCGNLVGFSPMVVLVRYAPNVIVVCIGGFWVLQGLPQETRSKLFVPWQLQVLPWTVFFLVGVALLFLFVQPLCVYVLEKKADVFSVYGQVNIIPQLFHQIKNVIQNVDSKDRDIIRKESPLVYGLATVYSASFVMLSEFVTLFIMLLLGDALASSALIMVTVLFILLSMLSFARLENTLMTAQLFHVPWCYVLSWGLMSSYFFYGTGHQPTFPGIHWYAAFVGTGGQFQSNLIPSILIGTNTFCSQILAGLTLPMLLIAPFTYHVMFSKWISFSGHPGSTLKKEAREDLKQGDLCIYDKQNISQCAIFKLSAKYMLYHGTRIFCCMLAAAIHCRHLMVWMIFAPRFIFEGIAFFVTLGSILVGYFLVIRIAVKVDRFVTELKKKH